MYSVQLITYNQELESIVDLRNKLIELINKYAGTVAFIHKVPSLNANIYEMLKSLDEIISHTRNARTRSLNLKL